MKPLKVALVFKCRSGIIERDNRAMGWWSYPVPEFEWDFFPAGDFIRLADYRDYDLVFHEDTARIGTYVRAAGDPPIAYLDIDSTLSEQHCQTRLALAGMADLVFADHEKLERLKPCGKPVRRLNYCVNERVFKPGEVRDLDVAFHCASGESRGFPGGKERNAIRRYLGGFCGRSGYSYTSGAIGLEEYAKNMGRAKVVVNWPRTILNRPHRVMDAMACGAALLTGPIPMVDGDDLEWGRHYLDYQSTEELGINLMELVNGAWEIYAKAGLELVMRRHTWSVRAQELRKILQEELRI